MGLQDYVDAMRTEWSYNLRSIRTQRISLLKRTRRLMGSIVIWLIGFLFIGIGAWIIALRFEGLMDRLKPHSMSIGQMTVDNEESRGLAELFRSRFDHHFRRPVAKPKETGFLEVVSLDTPELFKQQGLNSALAKMTLDVSGMDVAGIVQFVNQIAKPDEWVVEGDFQTQPDRGLLALRLSRGNRLIRTWYLERPGDTSANKSLVLQELIDDAIFQMVYDFGNEAEKDPDLSSSATASASKTGGSPNSGYSRSKAFINGPSGCARRLPPQRSRTGATFPFRFNNPQTQAVGQTYNPAVSGRPTRIITLLARPSGSEAAVSS